MGGSGEKTSSKALAKSWPYPKYQDFEAKLHKSAADWFAARQYPCHSKYPYCLAHWDDWPKNVILPEVADLIIQERAERQRAGEGFPLHNRPLKSDASRREGDRRERKKDAGSANSRSAICATEDVVSRRPVRSRRRGFAFQRPDTRIHHGLSSQAMLFNLVGPLLLRNDPEPLRQVLAEQGVEWPGDGATLRFEYEDRRIFAEGSGQPTSLDLAVVDAGGFPRIFIESKLAEREFGGCSVFERGDCEGRNPARDPSACYLHHLGRDYWKLLEKHGLLDGPLATSPVCLLANYYQFFRELLFAREYQGIFVLLSDERSPVFWSMPTEPGAPRSRGLMPFLLSLLPEDLRVWVVPISVQRLLGIGRHRGVCSRSHVIAAPDSPVRDRGVGHRRYLATPFPSVSPRWAARNGGFPLGTKRPGCEEAPHARWANSLNSSYTAT